MSSTMMHRTALVAASTSALFTLYGCKAGGENGSCETDDDCGGWYRCLDSACSVQECKTSADCDMSGASGTWMCHASGYCGKRCTSDSDCSTNADNVVSRFSCLDPDMVCTSNCAVDNDCGWESSNLFTCNDRGGQALHQCVPGNIKGSCKDNDDNCESCTVDDETKCFFCRLNSHEPDMDGTCEPVCRSSDTMTGFQAEA